MTYQKSDTYNKSLKQYQKQLGIKADGFFGEKTEQAVKDFQIKNNLTVDGIIGKNTINAFTLGREGENRNILTGNNIDLSKIQENVKPVKIEATELPTVSETPSFVEVPTKEVVPSQTGISGLLTDTSKLESEISTIEARMSQKEQIKDIAYEQSGLYEDMTKLNEQKAKLQELQDRQIEIPIEARQFLRGQQATKTEFAQITRPEIEEATLGALAQSRNVEARTNAINSNIAILDQKLKADSDREQFLYTQKTKALDKIMTQNSEIITNAQKEALENKKHQNAIDLEIKKADLKNTNRGAGLIAESGMGTGAINSFLSNPDNRISIIEKGMATGQISTIDGLKEISDIKTEKLAQAKVDKEIIDSSDAVISSSKLLLSAINDLVADENKLGFDRMTGNTSYLFSIAPNLITDPFYIDMMKKWDLVKNGTTLEAMSKLKGSPSDKDLDLVYASANALDIRGSAENNREALLEIRDNLMEGMLKAESSKKAIKTRYSKDFIQEGINLIEGKEAGVEAAIPIIQGFEGFRNNAYLDSAGVPTIGFGTTKIDGTPVKLGDTISRPQAEDLMKNQILNDYTKFVPQISLDITPSQFGALTSFEYNLGSGVWQQPTGKLILENINQGKNKEAALLMLRFDKSRNPQTGQLETNPGLTQRRQREAALLLA